MCLQIRCQVREGACAQENKLPFWAGTKPRSPDSLYPTTASSNHKVHGPALLLSHSQLTRKGMTNNCCPLLHRPSHRQQHRKLLHHPCVHHSHFCFPWQLSKKILQTFFNNTVKIIAQAATKVRSSKSEKTWNKNQVCDGKPFGLWLYNLWFLMHQLPTARSMSSRGSGQAAGQKFCFLHTPDLLWKISPLFSNGYMEEL